MNNTPEMINLKATITENLRGLRLDQALAKLFPDYSRGCIQGWIKEKQVTINGEFCKSKEKVRGDEVVVINAIITPKIDHVAQAMELDIIYEDDDILIINKPANLVVHPAAGNPDKTLLNALLFYYPKQENLPRAGIVHRLDKDTTGIMIIAKTLIAHNHLISQLQNRSISREYIAVVQGVMTAGGTINAPISRHPTQRTKMAVVTSGKTAITHYRVSEKYPAHTKVNIKLETGRTHQIRVHMAYKHYPIVGDKAYAGRLQIPKDANEKLMTVLRDFKRQALHAWRLTFKHPVTGDEMSWTAPIPTDMQQLIQALQNSSDNS